jgi:hypothetical protein
MLEHKISWHANPSQNLPGHNQNIEFCDPSETESHSHQEHRYHHCGARVSDERSSKKEREGGIPRKVSQR